MLKKGDKKAQFYLMAAIVIVAIMIGFVSVTNYAKRSSTIEIYDVKDELGIESDEVLEFGTLNLNDADEKSDLISRFSSNYTKYAGERKEIYIIYGNAKNIFVATYSNVSKGSVSVNFGSNKNNVGWLNLNITDADSQISEIDRGDQQEQEITVKVGDIERTFNLKEGENFYFIVSQNIGGEQYITESEVN